MGSNVSRDLQTTGDMNADLHVKFCEYERGNFCVGNSHIVGYDVLWEFLNNFKTN